MENKGIVVVLSTKNIVKRSFTWNTQFSLTVPENKLLAFPGLASSPYSSTLIIGKSLHEMMGYKYLGVNPTTGIFQFQGANGPTSSPAYTDQVDIGNTNPKFYGGVSNTFRYKRISLDIFLDFRKQNGYSSEYSIYKHNPPGAINSISQTNNEPTYVLNRWQQAGDIAEYQQFTATASSAAHQAIQYYTNSSAILTDASFIKLRTMSLSYNLPDNLVKKWHMNGLRFYLQGQNLLTLSKYKGGDPENQSPFILPPLRTITGGIQVNL